MKKNKPHSPNSRPDTRLGNRPDSRRPRPGAPSAPRKDRGRAESRSQNNESAAHDIPLLPGRKPLLELMKARPKAIRKVYRLDSLQADSEIKAALEELADRGITILNRNRDDLDELSGQSNHQGILTEVEPRTPVSLDELINIASKKNKLLLALDELKDPQNLGAVLRVADAAGVDGIITPQRRSALLTPTVRKISVGASEFIPITEVPNLAQAIRTLKAKGYWIVGTSLSEGSRPLIELDAPSPMAVVIGSEGKGLRDLTESLCDFLVQIPMRGKLQSLNASHAAAIVLYEITRKLVPGED